VQLLANRYMIQLSLKLKIESENYRFNGLTFNYKKRVTVYSVTYFFRQFTW